MAKMHFKKQQQNHHNPTETKTSFYSLLDIENQQPQHLSHCSH